MNKIKFALKNSAVLAVLITSFVACDKDFATVGSDIIGQNNFSLDSVNDYSVVAYTNPLGPVQTNGLPVNYLGAYNDQTYGLSSASFVSQMALATYSPDFGSGVAIDSVVLTIPYLSRAIGTDADGKTTYELDSIFGNGDIKLELFENKFFLNTIDPNESSGTPLKYFSNATTSNGTIEQSLLEGESIPLLVDNELDVFKPSADEIVLTDEDDEVTSRIGPALRVKLNSEYWFDKIITDELSGSIELSNFNNFNNYFRGLYIKATPINNDGSLALLNFGSSSANITIYYKKDDETEGAEENARISESFVLRFAGNSVNLLNKEFMIPQGNSVTGDEKLYLKGGEGSIAVLDLFNGGTTLNGNSQEFQDFKDEFVFTDGDGKFLKSKRLINEANLIFYVDQSSIEGSEPDRIYLYDLTNGKYLTDYENDLANTTNPNNSRISHLGKLERENNEPNGAGIRYKIRITEYINDLLLRDSTNVKLGLSVSTNINLENVDRRSNSPQLSVKNDNSNALVKRVPASSVLSPKGTVLFGNNTTNTNKKLYLEIYYTEL